MTTAIYAAGAVCWRIIDGKVHVLLVHRTVYGDGVDLASASAVCVPVGQGCRVCVRGGCAARQEEAIVAPAAMQTAGGRGPDR